MSKLIRFLSRRRTGKGIKRGVQQGDPKKNKHIINCTVVLLDGTDISIELPKGSLGDVLYQRVFYHLDLLETSYFGLQYTDAANVNHWLDPTKKIKKQVAIGPPYTLRLRVKFFPEEPSTLKEELTRYQFFLQCKADVLNGSLPVHDDTLAVELAALALQSELGDFDEVEHTPAMISEFRFVPNQSEEMEVEIYNKYKSLRGQRMTPDKAELQYLHKVKFLDLYGVDMHHVMGRDGLSYKLGLTPTGVLVYEGEEKIGLFYWPKITKFNFKRKKLILVVVDDIEVQAEGQAEPEIKQQEHTFVFRTENPKACKHLWKCAIEHHTFFRVVVQTHAERRGNKQGFIRLGSRFRYSGRTQFEQLNKSQARRSVRFERQPSKRFSRRQSLEAKERLRRNRPPGSLPTAAGAVSSVAEPAAGSPATPVGSNGATLPNGGNCSVSSPLDRLDNLIADRNGTLKGRESVSSPLDASEAAQAKLKGFSDTPAPPPRPVKDVNLYQNNQVKNIATKEKVPIEIKSNILKARADEERQSLTRTGPKPTISPPKVVVSIPQGPMSPIAINTYPMSPTHPGSKSPPLAGGVTVMQEDDNVSTESEDESGLEVFSEDVELLPPRRPSSNALSPISPIGSQKDHMYNGSRMPRNASTSSNRSIPSPTNNKQPQFSRDGDKSLLKSSSTPAKAGKSDDSIPLLGSPTLASPTLSTSSVHSNTSAKPEKSIITLSQTEEDPSFDGKRSARLNSSTSSRQANSLSNGEIIINSRPSPAPTPAPRKYEKRVCVTTEL